MELLDHLSLGFATALTATNLMYCFFGVLLGTFIGVLPGLGPTATIAMLLPITYYLSPTESLIMLAGIYYGSQYGGSTTAILMNLPGEVSSSVTAIDGYQMARKGQAGKALAIAAIGSFVAGTFATLVIAVAALPLSAIALGFGPAEYFALILLGLVASVALAHGSVMRGMAMIVTGMLFGLIGTDPDTGVFRFTFGIFQLSDGIETVAVALGVFGISEILRNLESTDETPRSTAAINSLMPSRADLRAAAGPIMRGSLLGSVMGVLPGGGSIISAFSSYALEKKISRTPERFGHGAIEGVAAPEAANNAGAQTSFIPMLTLGIPPNALMALMAGALMIQGITPGPNVVRNQPDLFWGVIASMWIGNVMLVILNLPLVGMWVALLKIPYRVMLPAIVIFSTVGVYSVNNSGLDLYALLFFGVLGYVFRKLGCEVAPFLVGFVLSDLLETHFRRALVYSSGDLATFVQNPVSAGILAVTALLIVAVAVPAIRQTRNKAFVDSDD